MSYNEVKKISENLLKMVKILIKDMLFILCSPIVIFIQPGSICYRIEWCNLRQLILESKFYEKDMTIKLWELLSLNTHVYNCQFRIDFLAIHNHLYS